MIALDELDAHVGLKRLELCRARSADDRTGARLLMNPLLRQRLARSKSSIVILLLMSSGRGQPLGELSTYGNWRCRASRIKAFGGLRLWWKPVTQQLSGQRGRGWAARQIAQKPAGGLS